CWAAPSAAHSHSSRGRCSSTLSGTPRASPSAGEGPHVRSEPTWSAERTSPRWLVQPASSPRSSTSSGSAGHAEYEVQHAPDEHAQTRPREDVLSGPDIAQATSGLNGPDASARNDQGPGDRHRLRPGPSRQIEVKTRS